MRSSCDVPVVSIGNLAVGGTGKTPTDGVAVPAGEGRRAARLGVLARGYGRAAGCGELNDEGRAAAAPSCRGCSRSRIPTASRLAGKLPGRQGLRTSSCSTMASSIVVCTGTSTVVCLDATHAVRERSLPACRRSTRVSVGVAARGPGVADARARQLDRVTSWRQRVQRIRQISRSSRRWAVHACDARGRPDIVSCSPRATGGSCSSSWRIKRVVAALGDRASPQSFPP